MSDHIYKVLELTGTSGKSQEEAVRNAISRAAKTVKHMRWFQVVETRGEIRDGEILHWQVTLKVGFTIEE